MNKRNFLTDDRDRRECIKTLLIITFIALMFNLFMAELIGDDPSYLDRLNTLGYVEASIDHFKNWSSRILIEAALMFFSNYFYLWLLINTAVMVGTVWIINKYTTAKMTAQTLLFTFGLYCMIPLNLMREAGWVATTLNYHWSVCFALFAFYPFYQKMKKEKLSVPMFLLTIPLLIFSSNQEQINLCFFAFTALVSIYLIRKRRYDIRLLISSLISFAGIVVFLLAPGNKVRTALETKERFPAFADFTFFNKVDVGISSFGKPFFIDSNILFFLLFSLVAFLVFQNSQNYYGKILAALPAGMSFIVYLGGTMESGFVHYASNKIGDIFSTKGLENWFLTTGTRLSLRNPGTWIATLLVLGLLVCLIYGLWMSFADPSKIVLAVLILLMGFFSRVMMGFSPTVWASGVRTYYIVFISALMLILMLVDELRKSSEKAANALSFIAAVMGVCTLILTVFNK